MQVWFWIWIAVIVASVVVEALTLDMVSVWFGAGAFIPMILAATNVCGWEIQMIIFIIVSALLIIFLRKITMRYLFKNSGAKTNKDSLIGLTARMLEATDFDTVGSIKINDVVWSAVGDNGQEIEKGKVVEIVAIAGNKLKVKEIQEESQKQIKNKKEKENEGEK